MPLMRIFFRPRWVTATAYLFYAIAGISFIFYQSSELRLYLGTFWFIVWNVNLALGGIIATIGALKEVKRIELIGIPGITIGLLVYALFLVREIPHSTSRGILLGFASIFMASCVDTIGRAIEIRKVLNISHRIHDEIDGDNGGAENG